MKEHGTLIVQRVIPHYRVKLFRALYDRYGVKVVTSARPPLGSFLNLSDPREHNWAICADIVYPDPALPERALVPVDWLLETYKPRSVVAEFGLRLSSSYSLPLRRHTGGLKRLAFWSHGWQMGRGFVGFRNSAVQYARLPLLASADVLATYSREGAGWLRSHLPFRQVISVGNTIDVSAIREVTSKAKPTSFGCPQLLCVGRLTADKRFDFAIELVRHLAPRFPNVGLTIIGDGPDRGRLESLLDPSVARHVRLLGAIYDEGEIAAHFAGADLFLVTGAAGLSVNHALAHGVPVIAFARTAQGPHHHPEIEYVVPGRSGILVEPYTMTALVESVTQAIESGELLKVRSTLPQFVESILSLDVMVENFGKLLSALET